MGELTVFASLGLTVTPLNNKAAWIVLHLRLGHITAIFVS
jgi:hypothetical protein